MGEPYSVEVTRLWDFKPFDMIGDGVYIRSISSNFTWEVATLTYREDEAAGMVYKSPIWGPALDIPLRLPMTVMRGVEPRKGE